MTHHIVVMQSPVSLHRARAHMLGTTCTTEISVCFVWRPQMKDALSIRTQIFLRTHSHMSISPWNTMAGDNIFNSLEPSDIIWQQKSGLRLAQVMACCLAAPSHYLNQCWLVMRCVLWRSPISKVLMNITHCMCSKIPPLKLLPYLQVVNELTHSSMW